MAIYKTLYAFKAVFGANMGDPETHPWSQGFPLTKQIPGGPKMISELKGINFLDLRYPKAHGMPQLRETICNYYKEHYGATIEPDNVMVFAGGKPALFAIMLFLRRDVTIRIAQAEYPAYHAMMERLGCKWEVVKSNEKNKFAPTNAEYI